MRDQTMEAMLLSDLDPCRLPKCHCVGLEILDSNRAELKLDTESGQRILIEIDSKAIEALYHLTSIVLKGRQGSQSGATHPSAVSSSGRVMAAVAPDDTVGVFPEESEAQIRELPVGEDDTQPRVLFAHSIGHPETG